MENNGNNLVPVQGEVVLSFDDKARAVLTKPEYEELKKFIDAGGKQLATDTVASFFSLYLNGSDLKEIHRLNKPFPYAAILWAFVRFDWDQQKADYLSQLQLGVREKLLKANLETISLLSDVLSAAHKKHGDKIKKFLQTGNEQDLGKALEVDTVHGLLKVVEGLQKLTGQDRTQVLKKEETLNVNVNASINAGGDTTASALEPEDAAKILNVLSEAKKKSAK